MSYIDFLQRIRTLVVVAMFADEVLRDRLVLKGGNLLDLVYDLSARSSVDIDFSIEGDFSEPDELARRIERTLQAAFVGGDYVPFDFSFREVPPVISEDLKDFWGGYKVEFKLISRQQYESLRGDINQIRRNAQPLGKRGSSKFSIDLSKHEFCAGKVKYQLEQQLIYGQSPQMFVCEKLRAICQQMDDYRETVKKHRALRARDFVDIYVVADFFRIDFSTEEFKTILKQTFASKRVPLKLVRCLEAEREVHRDDFESVRATVKPDFRLQDYDYYFDFVVNRCLLLEPLGDE